MKPFLVFAFVLFAFSASLALARLALAAYPVRPTIYRYVDVLTAVGRIAIVVWIGWLLFGGAA